MYEKFVVRLDARQWIDPNDLPLEEYRRKPKFVKAVKMTIPFQVETEDGTFHGKEGDYLIQDNQGRFSYSGALIFETQFDKVE